jgi:hypothetical protein
MEEETGKAKSKGSWWYPGKYFGTQKSENSDSPGPVILTELDVKEQVANLVSEIQIKRRDTKIVENCLLALQNLSLIPEYRLLMRDSSVLLIPLLLDVIKQNDHTMSLSLAVAVLNNLSLEPENRSMILAPELDVLSLIVKVAEDNTGDCLQLALGALASFALDPSARVPMITSFDLMPFLLKIVRDENSVLRDKALGIFVGLSMDFDLFSSVESITEILFPLLIEMIHHERNTSSLSRALFVVTNLTNVERNRVILAKPQFNVFSCLAEILRTTDNNLDRQNAVASLNNFLLLENCTEAIYSPLLGIVPLLIEIVRTYRDETRYYALMIIGKLSKTDKKQELAAPVLGLISLLNKIIAEQNEEKIHKCAVAILSLLQQKRSKPRLKWILSTASEILIGILFAFASMLTVNYLGIWKSNLKTQELGNYTFIICVLLCCCYYVEDYFVVKE